MEGRGEEMVAENMREWNGQFGGRTGGKTMKEILVVS